MSRSDSSLFIQTNSLRTTILAVYVDDIIIIIKGIEVLKTRMIADCF